MKMASTNVPSNFGGINECKIIRVAMPRISLAKTTSWSRGRVRRLLLEANFANDGIALAEKKTGYEQLEHPQVPLFSAKVFGRAGESANGFTGRAGMNVSMFFEAWDLFEP